jgi:hypothetical protein
MAMARIVGSALVVLGIAWGAGEARGDAAPLYDAAAPAEVRPWPLPDVLERMRVKVTGWAEAMATVSPGTDSDVLRGRAFDDDAEGVRLHQAYFAIERTFSEGRRFDLGGKFALLYGTDARFIHARGLLDDQAPREYQWDLLEFWGSARFPVRNGLRLKVGKFTTPMGYEVIEAPNNLLPSHTFLFGYAIPFTNTGGILSLDVSSAFTVSYGLLLGWDVWEDNNDALSHYAGVTWTSPSGSDTLVAQGILGAEQPDDDSDLRLVLDATWGHEWSDRWKTAINADFGTEEGAAGDGGSARWWGAAAYVTRTFSERLRATARAEFFRDEDGTRLGDPASLTGLTLGLDWTPCTPIPIFHVRPEIRWDHSFDGPFFDDGTSEDQISLSLDVIVGF